VFNVFLKVTLIFEKPRQLLSRFISLCREFVALPKQRETGYAA